MKKRICALALAALLMTGCGAKPSASGNPVENTADYTGLRMLQSGDENGFYQFDRNDIPGWRHLCYVDYETKQAVPLCAQPNCTHDSESCQACLPIGPAGEQTMIGTSYVWILDENTILMQYGCGKVENGEQIDETWLDLADRNGSNRRTLLHQESNQGETEFYFSGLADENALYGTMESDGLYRLPLDGGKPELWVPELSKLDVILGALDHKLIVSKGVDPYKPGPGQEDPLEKYPITDDMTMEEMEEAMAKRDQMYQEFAASKPTMETLYTIDVNTQKCEELCTWDSAAEPRYDLFVGKNRLWWVTKDAQLGWLDLDGNTGTVNVQWPEDLKEAYANNSPEEKVFVIPEWETCGKLIVNLPQPVTEDPNNGRGSYGSDRYAIDLESGAVTALPQHYLDLTYESPVNLWAETGKGFLVNYAVEYGKVQDSFMGNDAASPRLGLISYEDFFAGENAWQEIQLECKLDVYPVH